MKRVYLTNKLRDWRHEQGYNIKEFAEMLQVQADAEVSEWSLYMYERGKRSIAMPLAVEISRLTKIELKELVEKR